MPQFDPRWDSIYLPAAAASDFSAADLRPFLQSDSEVALDRVRQQFEIAVVAHHVSSKARVLLDDLDPCSFLRDAGQVFATIDHFTAGVPVPQQSRAALDPERAGFPAYRSYLQQRAQECLKENASQILAALFITFLIPERWIPVDAVEKEILRYLSQQGCTSRLELHLDLIPPRPGGVNWLRERTASELATLSTVCSRRNPKPAVLISQLEGRPACTAVVIVGCTRTRPGIFTLEFWAPLDGNRIRRETFSDSGTSLPSSYSAMEPSAPLGLIVLDYHATEPPMTNLQRRLGYLRLRRIAWLTVRMFRRMKWAMRNDAREHSGILSHPPSETI